MASTITATVGRSEFRTIRHTQGSLAELGELLMVLEHRGGVVWEANVVDVAVRGRAHVELGRT